jgi:hypothetical protein
MEPACTCGHAAEEHGNDKKFPGSTACSVPGCPCIAYEADGTTTTNNEPGHVAPRPVTGTPVPTSQPIMKECWL